MAKETKFRVEMETFRKHVHFMKCGLGNSKTDHSVMMVRCVINDNKLTMFSTNKEIFTQTTFPISIVEAGENNEFACLGGKLSALVHQVEAELLNFTVQSDNLECKAGFLSVNFELFDSSALKMIQDGVADHLEGNGTLLPREFLVEALVCAKSCISSNSVRPDVNHAEIRSGNMLSSDGRKIMVYNHQSFADELTFKCPAGSINNMVAAVKVMDTEGIKMLDGDSYFYIRANMADFSCGVRKIERSFPAVEGTIKDQAGTDTVVLDKNVLENAIRGVVIGLAEDEVRISCALTGEGKAGSLEISGVSTVGKKSFEKTACGRTATGEISFPVSYRHILESLSVFKGDTIVEMEVLTDKNILMLRDKTENRRVLTVIPFRTDAQIEQEKAEAKQAAEEKEAAEADHDVGELDDDSGDLSAEAA